MVRRRRERAISRRELLAGGAAALGAVACASRLGRAQERGSPPPNLLLLVSDDHGREDLGCYGGRVATPAIDRIAAEGLRFTHAFTPTAICQPSRAALLTGLHGSTSGADGFTPIRDAVIPLPAALRGSGYRTALLGKTHLEPLERFGFDLVVPSEELQSGRDVDAIAGKAKAFVKQCASESRPFFLDVSFDDPHYPWPLTDAEAQAELPRWQRRRSGVDPRDRALGGVAGRNDPAAVRVPALLPDRPEIRAELARYADAITRLDRGVARLLEMLDELRVAERTIVLFLSDNGMDFPFHKTTLWEGGVRLPLLVRAPGITPRGASCDGLVSFVDVMPTVLELAGVQPARRPVCEGRSFAAALADPTVPLRDELLLTHSRHRQDVPMPSRGLRTRRFKLLRNFWPEGAEFLTQGMRHPAWDACVAAAAADDALAERIDRYLHRPDVELYDLEADPLERTNLAGSPAHAEIAADLRARLRAALTAIADPLAERI